MIAYKYLHPSRTSVLGDRLIRFTQATALNDPFETTPDMRKLEQSFRRYAIRKIEAANLSPIDHVIALSRVGELVNKHFAEFHRRNSGAYAILSLTKVPNSLLMWAHYCDSHRGFVIGFDTTHAFFTTRQFQRFSTLAEMHYSNVRPVMPAPAEWDGSREQVLRVLEVDLAELLFYTKSEDWQYEQELRMIANPRIADRTDKTQDGQDIYLYQFPAECLKQVIFGIRMSTHERQRIATIVREFYGEAVQTFETVLSPEKFDLDIVPASEKYNKARPSLFLQQVNGLSFSE